MFLNLFFFNGDFTCPSPLVAGLNLISYSFTVVSFSLLLLWFFRILETLFLVMVEWWIALIANFWWQLSSMFTFGLLLWKVPQIKFYRRCVTKVTFLLYCVRCIMLIVVTSSHHWLFYWEIFCLMASTLNFSLLLNLVVFALRTNCDWLGLIIFMKN